MGTVIVVLIVLAIILVAAYYYLSPSRPNPVLIGNQQVKVSDLPGELQGRSDAELQARLDEMVERGSEGMKEWWGTRLSREECEEARLLALYLGDKQTAMRCLCWVIRKTYFDYPGRALILLDTAISEARANGFDEELAQCYWQRGICLEQLGLYDWAAEDYQKSLDKYEKLDQPDQQVLMLALLGSVHSDRWLNYEQADEVYSGLDELIGKAGTDRLAPLVGRRGYNLMNLGRYPEAIEKFELGKDCAAEAGLPGKVKNAQATVGELHLILNDPDTGRELLNQAVASTALLPGHHFPFGPNRILAEYLAATGDEQGAIELLEETLVTIAALEAGLAPEAENAKSQADILRIEKLGTFVVLGNIYLGLDDYQAALEAYQQADALVDHGAQFIMPRERMEVNLAEAYIGLEKYGEALPLLEVSRDCPVSG